MSGGATLTTDRSRPPPVLLPEDLANLLDLPSERAAREFVARHGVPHVRLGGRVYVRLEALLEFLAEHETVQLTEAEVREKAAGELSGIAPRIQERQTRRKLARRKARNA